MQASKGPIALERPQAGKLADIELANRDAVTGILTRLWGGPDGVRIRRYGHRINGNSLQTLYRQSDGCCWVLHTKL